MEMHANNYEAVLRGNFFIYLRNSLVIIAISVGLILLIAATMSYCLVRVKFKASGVILAVIIACMAIPVT